MKKFGLVFLVLLLSACAQLQPQVEKAPYGLKQFNQDQAQAAKAYASKDYEQALSLYKRIYQHVKDDANVVFRLANTYSRLNLNQKAVEHYRLALQLDPKLSKAWFNMGMVQLKENITTWSEMASQLPESDPLHAKAKYMAHGLLDYVDAIDSVK